MSRQLLEQISPSTWESGQSGSTSTGFLRTKWLQNLNDLLNRPVLNRGQASTNGTTFEASGAVQSTGIGIPAALQPKRYAELTVKARVSFSLSSAGPAFLFVYRSTIGTPAEGVAPHASDVVVGGGSFAGGAMTPNVSQSASFSFLDSGLSVTAKYFYYFAIEGPSGSLFTLAKSSQLLVMERS